jgi:TolB-like protein
LETIAEPGGILISSTAHDHVGTKVKVGFKDMGVLELKNIAQPVRAYRVTGTPTIAVAAPKSVSDKPSIAVLPFINMSGDPEQEYFSDGLTEDIITELSRFKNLLVIARNSSFTFKGQAVDVKKVGRKLDAHYVVEGSVRRSGNRIRITAQLLETPTGKHLWAERYDRDLEDIFVVQDELVRAISGVIPGHLDRHAVEKLRRKPPDNLTAYDCELRGRWALAHWSEGLSVALEWFEKAAKADPNYAMAHAGMAYVYAYEIVILGLPPERTRTAQAKEHAQRATVLDDRNPTVQVYAGMAYLLTCEYQLSRAHAERAVFLNPNDPFVRGKAPTLELDVTDYGYRYAGIRPLDGGEVHVRAYHFILPFHQIRPGRTGAGSFTAVAGHMWVPMDDENTMVYNWEYSTTEPLTEEDRLERRLGNGPLDVDQTTFRSKKHRGNNYLQDRHVQRTETFSGIDGVNAQDRAVQESMGPIVDRSREHLGPADRAVIQARRLLLQAIRTVETGGTPAGVESTYYPLAPAEAIVSADTNWRTLLASATSRTEVLQRV